MYSITLLLATIVLGPLPDLFPEQAPEISTDDQIVAFRIPKPCSDPNIGRDMYTRRMISHGYSTEQFEIFDAEPLQKVRAIDPDETLVMIRILDDSCGSTLRCFENVGGRNWNQHAFQMFRIGDSVPTDEHQCNNLNRAFNLHASLRTLSRLTWLLSRTHEVTAYALYKNGECSLYMDQDTRDENWKIVRSNALIDLDFKKKFHFVMSRRLNAEQGLVRDITSSMFSNAQLLTEKSRMIYALPLFGISKEEAISMAQRYFLDPNEIDLRLKEEFEAELSTKLPIEDHDRCNKITRDITNRYFGTFDLRCHVRGCRTQTIGASDSESD